MPTGPARAPETDSTAAPGYVAEPVAPPTTPRVYLSPPGPGCGHQPATSVASGTRSAGPVRSHGSSPMSTRSTSPAQGAARPTTSPGLRAPKVTVTSAATASPSTAPVSTSMPDGTSTAITSGRPP